MANVNGLTSNSYSSSSSIYGNRNVLSGLASGMDTEAMIQNSVTGYQTKITELQQQQTKIEWKQDAVRELTDQMYSISQKYTSYTSKTNLSSNAFFKNSITTTANGKNAAAVSATGKANSEIQITAVKSLATATRYAVNASALDLDTEVKAEGSAISWEGSRTVGTVSGTLMLKFGTQSIDLAFGESDNAINTAQGLKDAIVEKLSKIDVTVKGNTVKADTVFDVAVSDDKTFTFKVKDGVETDGESLYINSFIGNLGDKLGVTKPASTENKDKFANTSFTVSNFSLLTEERSTSSSIAGKSVSVTLDGTTKEIKIGSDITDLTKLKADLQTKIDKAFGKNRVTVGSTDAGGLAFTVGAESGSTLKVSSAEVSDILGLGGSGLTNYFNAGRSIGDLLSTNGKSGEAWLNANARTEVDASEMTTKDGKHYVDGKLIQKDTADGKWYRADENGDWIYSMKINGVSVGEFTKDSSVENVINTINGSTDAGVNVSYSTLTSQFVFTARETGVGGDISFDDAFARRMFYADNTPQSVTLGKMFGSAVEWASDGTASLYFMTPADGVMTIDGLTKDMTVEDLIGKIDSLGGSYTGMLSYDEDTGSYSFKNADGTEMTESQKSGYGFLRDDNFQFASLTSLLNGLKGATKTKGVDAEVDVTVNGEKRTLKRSSNAVTMDGMTVTLKETFEAEDETDVISFTTKSNADDIIETVRGFVEDVNSLLKKTHDAFTTQPLKKSGSSKEGYMPLTEEDKSSMSESAVKAYEEKAKTGLLFSDTDVSQLYNSLVGVIQTYGSERVTMESIGLSTTYSDGVTSLSLDENKLRTALESDPDKVRDVFTKTKDIGASTDGLMTNLKKTLNAYGSVSVSSPGILVKKAGSKLSALSLINNNLQSQYDNLSSQVERWQTRLSDKIDYYTKQFTQLEKLMSTMNNQSSMLADLMGY